MRGWIIDRLPENGLKIDTYGLDRLLETAKKLDMDVKLVHPPEFDLTVTGEDKKTVRHKGASAPLPDFVVPRMGSKTTYFGLAVLRHLEKRGVHCVNN